MSIFCLEAKSTPPNELVFCLNRYAVEVGEEIRVFSLARGFDRHDQRKDVQRRRNLAKAKATFNHHLLLFFSLENQNLIFLCCGSCYLFFSPKRYCFPNTLHEAFFLLLFLRPQSAAQCHAEQCCRYVVWRMISPQHKGMMLRVCVGISFPLVFTHRLAMKVPVVISSSCCF